MTEILPAEKRFMASVKAAERKRQQRQRDRAAGLVEVLVKVPRDRSQEIRAIADQMRQSDAPPQA